MKYPFEIIKINLPNKSKMPMVLELPVPNCAPYLVGNPKQSVSALKWVEDFPKSGKVFCWGLDLSLDDLLPQLKQLILDRFDDLSFPSIEDAQNHLQELGLGDSECVQGFVVPKDASLFGSVIVFDNSITTKLFPVIHNAKTGVCFIKE